MSWTPGPWEAWIEGEKFITGELAWGGDTCVTARINGNWQEVAMTPANARLMAASPQMAKALVRCVEVIEADVELLRKEGFEGASWQLGAIRQGREALARLEKRND